MTLVDSPSLQRRLFLKRMGLSFPVAAVFARASSALAAGKKVRIVQFDISGTRTGVTEFR